MLPPHRPGRMAQRPREHGMPVIGILVLLIQFFNLPGPRSEDKKEKGAQ